jgi:SAM-dependent methyltransferase
MHPEYQPFPNIESRNARQGWLEIPLFSFLLNLPRKARVLEIGCGRGVALPVIARLRAPNFLVGIDVDATLLREAKRGEKGCPNLVQGDVRVLPFADGTFDVVVDFGTCYHIAYPEAALAEIGRVLAPGGLFATETKLSQLLSHPVRSLRRKLTWRATRTFKLERHAVLWMSFRKRKSTPPAEAASSSIV